MAIFIVKTLQNKNKNNVRHISVNINGLNIVENNSVKQVKRA